MKIIPPSVAKSGQKTKPLPTRFYMGMILLVLGAYLTKLNLLFGLISLVGLGLLVNLNKK